MEERIVVISTGIESSSKTVGGRSNATDLRDVHCVRLIRQMFFLGWSKWLRRVERSRFLFFISQTRGRRGIWKRGHESHW
jgi:hypothetical protein